MAGAQQFCLKWNNYHVNIASSFDALRVDEDFVDVTLACSGLQLKAHRMVLSACSPFFRQLLKSNPHPHPIVILRDVSQSNMSLLLDFMYHGEVNVAQEALPEFLKVAELLKVKGLADEKREEEARTGPNGQSGGARTPTCSPAPPAASQPADESPPPPPAKRHRPLPPPLPALLQHPQQQQQQQPPPPPAAPAALPPPPTPPLGYVEQAAVKREPMDAEPGDFSSPERLRPGGGNGGGGEERIRQMQRQTSLSVEEAALLVSAEAAMEEAEQTLPAEASRGQPVGPGPSAGPHEASSDPLSGGGASGAGLLAAHAVLQHCPHCPAVFSSKSTIKDHVARVHFPVPVQCHLCGKMCANQGVLRVHKSRVHRQRAPQ